MSAISPSVLSGYEESDLVVVKKEQDELLARAAKYALLGKTAPQDPNYRKITGYKIQYEKNLELIHSEMLLRGLDPEKYRRVISKAERLRQEAHRRVETELKKLQVGKYPIPGSRPAKSSPSPANEPLSR